MNVREIFWPVLEQPSAPHQAGDAEQQKLDMQAVRAAKFHPTHIAVVIEEARRLTDAENARRTGADTRATTYLAMVGVLAPILATLTPAAVDAKIGIFKSLVTLTLFIAAGSYLLGCGFWSFRVLKVSRSARVDIADLVEIAGARDLDVQLAKRLLIAVRWSRRDVNGKLSFIKMAHEFAFRALVTFVLAMIMRQTWDPAVALLKVVGLGRQAG